jgi:acetylornithine deacetylase
VVAGVPFATDGSSFAELGVPTIVLGPGSIDRAHGAVEWVECEQVLQASEIYQRIMVTQGPSDEA